MATKKKTAPKTTATPDGPPQNLFDLAAAERDAIARLEALAAAIEEAEGDVSDDQSAEFDRALDALIEAELSTSKKLDATGFAAKAKREEAETYEARRKSAQRLVDSLAAKRNAADRARRWIEGRALLYLDLHDLDRVKGDFWTLSGVNNGGALPITVPGLEGPPESVRLVYGGPIPAEFVKTIPVLDEAAVDLLVQDTKDAIEADLPAQDQRWKDAGFKAAERTKLASAYRDTELAARLPDWIKVGERSRRLSIR